MSARPSSSASLATAAAAAAIAVLALVAAGCGGSSGSSSGEVASIGGTTTSAAAAAAASPASSSTDRQEVILEYTQCMRDEGIDLPDPNFSGGRGRLGLNGVDPDDPDFQAAQEKCRPILERIRQEFDAGDRQALQDAALEFAQCMRKNGIDVEDPDFSGGGGPGRGRGGFFREVDRDDPDFQAAMEKCRSAFSDLGGPFGRGGPG